MKKAVERRLFVYKKTMFYLNKNRKALKFTTHFDTVN